MKILHRFILKRFSSSLFIFFLLFASFFILIEFQQIEVKGGGADTEAAAHLTRYLLLRLPFLAYFSIPIAVMTAAVFTVAQRATLSETIAANAAGISPLLFAAPITALSSLLAFLLLAGTEWRIPEMADEADYIRLVKIEKKAPPSRDYPDLAFVSRGRYVIAQRFSPVEKVLDNVLVITPDASHSGLERKDTAARLSFSDTGGWKTQGGGGVTFDFPSPAAMELTAASTGFKALTEKPVEAVKVSTLVEEYLLLKSLRETSEAPLEMTKEMVRRMVKINVKLSFPVTLPFLGILGAGVGMRLGRRRGIIYALSGALGFTLAYLLLLKTSVKFADIAANTPDLQLYAGFVPWMTPLLVGAFAIHRMRT